MRTIDTIVIHYSATYPGQDIGAAEIEAWHVGDNGWRAIGYHFVVRLDGTVEKGRPVSEPGAHVRGHNRHTLGICYVGGLVDGNPHDGHDTRTKAQRAAVRELVRDIQTRYGPMDIVGHRDLVATECPGFDVAGSDLAELRYFEILEGWPEPDPIPIVPPNLPIRQLRGVDRTRVEALERACQEEGVTREDLRKAARIFARWIDEMLRDMPWYARAVAVLRGIRALLREIGR